MGNIDFSFFDRVNNVYDLGGRMGPTGYIDFLTKKEVPKNLMKGVDCYGRKFLTLKVGGIDLDNNKFFTTSQVFFERYSAEPYIVGADMEGSFIWTTGGTHPIQYQLINDLVDGKLVKIRKEHRFISSNCNVILANMDYWENLAAKKIQKNWNNYRFNPKNKICSKILIKKLNNYLN